ncbi:MAG TPA: hypothetical protein VN041_11485 [Microbacterium sp.]|nr:hypothetical protein [Microbacterium sp.]
MLALESVDFGADVAEAVLAADPVEVDGRVSAEVRRRDTGESADVALVPYHSWAQRGPSTMRVWLPTS